MTGDGQPTVQWDITVLFQEKEQRWWWNAWHAPSATELNGYADTQENARAAMARAVQQVSVPKRRSRRR